MIRIASDNDAFHKVPRKAPPRVEKRKQKHVKDEDLDKSQDSDLLKSSKIRVLR